MTTWQGSLKIHKLQNCLFSGLAFRIPEYVESYCKDSFCFKSCRIHGSEGSGVKKKSLNLHGVHEVFPPYYGLV
jgi:hypothetical protein